VGNWFAHHNLFDGVGGQLLG
jgi:hypothetical protein